MMRADDDERRPVGRPRARAVSAASMAARSLPSVDVAARASRRRAKRAADVLGEARGPSCRRARCGCRRRGRSSLPRPEVAGERAGLGGDALHQVAVAREHVGVVVDDRVARAVEARRQVRLGDGHADGVGEPWPSGPVVASTPGREVALRVAGRAAAPLPEALELVEREVVAGQVQQGVEQHRAVPGRQHEAVAVRPAGIGRVVPQEARPEHVGHRRGAHRQPGMARVGLLDGVDGEEADRVDRQRVELRCRHWKTSFKILARKCGRRFRPARALAPPYR